MISILRTFGSKLLPVILILIAAASTPHAQPACEGSPGEDGSFDLVLFGTGLEIQSLDLYLKVNPWLDEGGTWQSITTEPGGRALQADRRGYRARILTGLPCGRFIGQDIRENYLELRVENGSNEKPIKLNAIYAFHHTGSSPEEMGKTVLEQVRSRPIDLERHSLARFIAPRPIVIRPGTAFVEKIELPVRGNKPGVREVEWLEILFGSSP